MVYDCAIVGTGPAGLAAALNLKAHNKTFVWIGSPGLSEKIRRAEKIANYPGIPNVSGVELASRFAAQIQLLDIEIQDQVVTEVIPFGEYYALMAGSEFYEAYSVILASGVLMSNTVHGEDTFLGRGVSYCATCDGNLYKGKRLAVICSSQRFEEEVTYLSSLASEILLFPQYKINNAIASNIRIISDTVSEIQGDQRVSGITTFKGNHFEVDGVFCLRDSISLSRLLPSVELDGSHIRVNRSMATNLNGVFAAGDCTGRPYQYAKAIGEGNIAALSAISYISTLNKT